MRRKRKLPWRDEPRIDLRTQGRRHVGTGAGIEAPTNTRLIVLEASGKISVVKP